jgi:type II secretory pathway pseudopilin PulG
MKINAMTIIEILVSMIILMIIAGGVYATFSIMGGGAEKLSPLDFQGINYARETLEKLKNDVSTDAARAGPLAAGRHDDPLPASEFTSKFGATRFYDVTDAEINSDGLPNFKKVTVTVRWNDEPSST